MMKIQLVGTRNKVDFALYLGHMIAAQGKRVLVIDATSKNLYERSITHLEEGEFLFEIQGVEILCCAKDWKSVEDCLNAESETFNNYDCIIVDMDSIDVLISDWPTFDHTLYISDDDKFNIHCDIELLHRFLDENDGKSLRRVHFESPFKVPEGYIELLMNNRVEFSADSEVIEYDDQEGRLRIMMQHNQVIPYGKLTKEYKELLVSMVVEWFGLDKRQIAKAAKPSLFGNYKTKKTIDQVS